MISAPKLYHQQLNSPVCKNLQGPSLLIIIFVHEDFDGLPGNICRSSLAEGILQHKAAAAGFNWTVESAGTNGFHVDEAPHHLSQKVATQNGINICEQRARKFVAKDFEQFDKIYVMAEDVMNDVKRIAGKYFDADTADYFLNELNAGKNQDVPDPWYGGEEGFVEVYDLIDKACDAIIAKESVRKN